MKHEIKREVWTIPYARYELSRAWRQIDGATTHRVAHKLQKAFYKSEHNFDVRLHFRVHLAQYQHKHAEELELEDFALDAVTGGVPSSRHSPVHMHTIHPTSSSSSSGSGSSGGGTRAGRQGGGHGVLVEVERDGAGMVGADAQAEALSDTQDPSSQPLSYSSSSVSSLPSTKHVSMPTSAVRAAGQQSRGVGGVATGKRSNSSGVRGVASKGNRTATAATAAADKVTAEFDVLSLLLPAERRETSFPRTLV